MNQSFLEAKMSRKNQSFSIKTMIITVTLSVFMVVIVMMGVIIFTNWYKIANRNATLLATEIEEKIHNQIDDFMFTPYHINEVNQRIFDLDLLDIENRDLREKFFVDVLRVHQGDVYSTAFATADGYYFGARVNIDGEIEIMRKDETTNGVVEYYSINDGNTADEYLFSTELFDPRTRDWYIAAENEGGPTVSPIFKHFILDELTFSTVWPVYDDQSNLVGVLANHVLLSQLDEYLSTVMEPYRGTSIIFERSTGYLLANSLNELNFTINDQHLLIRNTFESIAQDTLKGAYLQYTETGDSQFKHTGIGGTIYFNTTSFQDSNIDWVIVSSIPASFFTSEVYRTLNITIVSAIFIALLAVFAYIKLTQLLFRPLEGLVVATNQVAQGKFNVQFEKRRDDEIGRLSDSFNKMTHTISSLVNNLENLVEERTRDLEIASNEVVQTKDHLRLILDTTAEGIYGIDLNGRCTIVNHRALLILGFNDESELIGKNMHQMIHHHKVDGKEHPIKDCKIFLAMRQGLGQTADNEVFFKKDGTQVQVKYSSYPQYKNKEIIGAVISFTDNTEEKQRNEQILYISYHDHLTGLYNRRYFVESLEKMSDESLLPIGIMMIDLNALKLFNDAFGHLTGDEALKQVSNIIQKNTVEGEIACRLSGDEFALVIPYATEERMYQLKHQIKDEIKEVEVKGINISVAVGYELKHTNHPSIDEIVGKAENHMYKDKMTEGVHVKNDTVQTILESLTSKHPEEKEHAEKVSQLCETFGQILKMSNDEVDELKITALYHDIGKISIPDELLSKPEHLNDDEYEIMKKHAEVGYQILKSADQYAELANATLAHHEHFDGSGYPRGIKGKEIPLNARIIAIADAYEHMTSNRPYHKKRTKDEAIQELTACAGTQFDPELVSIFINKVIK